jgi:uridine kinase
MRVGIGTSGNHPVGEVRQERRGRLAAVDDGVRRFDLSVERISCVDKPVRIVGVDGCGGAGKTTFAARLSRAAGGVPVVHTDDFASHEDALGWWPRFRREVIDPLQAGEPAVYRPYDWVTRRPADRDLTIEPAGIVIVEGVGATRRAWRDALALRIWVDCPRDVRLRRGIARDGEALREFWQWWMAAEDAYVADEQPQHNADLVVDGDPQVAHDPAVEYVELSAPR